METKKQALADIEAAVKAKPRKEDAAAGSVQDVISAMLSEPNGKKRKKLAADFRSRHADVAAFISDNAELINSEAEAALICAAVGGTSVEKEISYKGGRRQEKIRRRQIQPNAAALSMLLKNRMPDRYSDHPTEEIEIEDVSEINEVIDGEAEKTEEKDNSI